MADSIGRTDLAEALASWLAPILPLRAEAVPAPLACDRVLAGALVAWRALPPYARSAVEGYAVRAADLVGGIALPIAAGGVWAGMTAPALDVGQAMFVATGAALPDGADSVLPVELARLGEGAGGARLEAIRPVGVGANVRQVGEDLGPDEEALPAGTEVTPDRLPLVLAAAGGRAVLVAARPRVLVLPSGDELVRPGQAAAGTEVMEVAGSAVAARVRQDGGVVHLADPLPDRLEAIRDALAQAAGQADIVVTVGGASVGERDHAARALVAAGGSLRFHGLRLRPGTPAFGGRLGGAAVLGLPGNPVAALTIWELLGRPALLRLAGRAAPEPFSAPLERACERRPVRDDRYLRGSVWTEAGGLRVRVWDGQNAGMLVPLARTNALVRFPAGLARLDVGTAVEVRLTGRFEPSRPAWARA